MRLARLFVVLAVAAIGFAAQFVWTPAPEVQAVGPSDILGVYAVKLRGEGFDRAPKSEDVNATLLQQSLRGTGLLRVSQPEGNVDPRFVNVELFLEGKLQRSFVTEITPGARNEAALTGRGVLVGDSLTIIGNAVVTVDGRPLFANALVLRFAKRGRKLTGTWIVSIPGSDADLGRVAGVGLSLRGKRLKSTQITPIDAVPPAVSVR